MQPLSLKGRGRFLLSPCCPVNLACLEAPQCKAQQ